MMMVVVVTTMVVMMMITLMVESFAVLEVNLFPINRIFFPVLLAAASL